MAYWPEIVRDKPVLSLIVVTTASIVAWFAAARWGSAVWVAASVLALTCIALFPWYQRRRVAHAHAAADTFSFGDVLVRMQAKARAKDQVEALTIARRRREQVLVAGQPAS